MGHVRLGDLPKTKKWSEIVDLVAEDGSLAAIARATLQAASGRFLSSYSDPALVESLRLLMELPSAAREEDFRGALAGLGIRLRDDGSLADLLTAFTEAVDSHVGAHQRSDVGEIAQLAAVEALGDALHDRTQGLFGASEADIRQAIASLGTVRQFGTLARSFYARLTGRFLGYFLSRELSNHVGPGRRFPTIDAHAEFNTQLDHHCWQTARIVEIFAGEWRAKTRWQKGRISRLEVTGFAQASSKKIADELGRGA